jgi:hypothetical protein|tara:strand:+ start:190 stop:372 length:183 start_codon:yes stop_codon:yes gene_type:complete
MATKIVRTVIGGKVIETPVETADPVEEKAPKAKSKKAIKATTPEPESASDACGLKTPADD